MNSDESPSKIKLTDLKGLYPYIFHLCFFLQKTQVVPWFLKWRRISLDILIIWPQQEVDNFL
jgi:hypothetical protein